MLPEIERRITEALLSDERVYSVSDFSFQISGSKYHVTFIVQTEFGELEVEKRGESLVFEEQTYEAILDRMLDRGSDLIDKREGSVFYDAVAPASLEIAQAYWELENVMNEGFADTASYEYLARRGAERYIYPPRSDICDCEGEICT